MLFILQTIRDRVISIKVWTGLDLENLAIVPWKKFEFSEIHPLCLNFGRKLRKWFFTPQPLRAVGVLFSPMVSGWVGGRGGWRVAGKSLSGLYLRNHKG